MASMLIKPRSHQLRGSIDFWQFTRNVVCMGMVMQCEME